MYRLYRWLKLLKYDGKDAYQTALGHLQSFQKQLVQCKECLAQDYWLAKNVWRMIRTTNINCRTCSFSRMFGVDILDWYDVIYSEGIEHLDTMYIYILYEYHPGGNFPYKMRTMRSGKPTYLYRGGLWPACMCLYRMRTLKQHRIFWDLV